MLPIPDGKFDSRDELLCSARKYAMGQGYGISIASSKKKLVVLQCDRGGAYRVAKGRKIELESNTYFSQQKLTSSSRKISCLFLVCGYERGGKWELHTKRPIHNHEKSPHIMAHPMCRRMDDDEIEKVKHFFQTGAKPRQVVSSLRLGENPCYVTSKDIYNLRLKIRKLELNGKSSIIALISELETSKIFEKEYELDDEHCISRLIIAPKTSVNMLRKNYSCILLDCTYKTNRFKMPLLHVVGLSPNNKTFSICFVFLSSEKLEDYTWALQQLVKLFQKNSLPEVCVTDRELALMNALEIVFPNTQKLLCQWHINKNVVAKCKPDFNGLVKEWGDFYQTWNEVVKSNSKKEFVVLWEKCSTLFYENQKILSYLEEIWFPWKERFVNAWADRCLHLGSKSTSRIEGAHATLKSYLQTSTGDLRSVVEKLEMMVKNQYQEFNASNASDFVRIPHFVRETFFSNLTGLVSNFALQIINKEYELAKKSLESGYDLDPCTLTLRSTMGLPCSHFILDLLTKQENILVTHIHKHWYLYLLQNLEEVEKEEKSEMHKNANFSKLLQDWEKLQENFNSWTLHHQKYATIQLEKISESKIHTIFDPKKPNVRGRPIGSKKKKDSTTKRDPSHFEHVEGKSVIRKCSFCKKTGHNLRKCPTMFNQSFQSNGGNGKEGRQSNEGVNKQNSKSKEEVAKQGAESNEWEEKKSSQSNEGVSNESSQTNDRFAKQGSLLDEMVYKRASSLMVPLHLAFCLREIHEVGVSNESSQTNDRLAKQGSLLDAMVYKRASSLMVPLHLAFCLREIHEVMPDGNCGFRVVASQLYGSEHNWVEVRISMIEHLLGNREHYEDLFGTIFFKKLHSGLDHHKGVAKKCKWFATPEMPILLATQLERLIVIVSQNIVGSNTYIPYTKFSDQPPICLVYVDKNHFRVGVLGGGVLPPVEPQWFGRNRNSVYGERWLEVLNPRFQNWNNHLKETYNDEI